MLKKLDHQWGFEEMHMSAVRLYWATEEAEEAKKGVCGEEKA